MTGKDHYATLFFEPDGKKHGDFCMIEKDNGLYDIFIENDKTEDAVQGGFSYGNRYGLAFTRDGLRWEYQGTILRPGEKGAWDDRSLWAAHVIERDGEYVLLYSAIADRKDAILLTQQFGIAVSQDLKSWVKQPWNPVIKNTDTGKHYVPKSDNEFCWRDANLIHHEDGYLCILVAKDPSAPAGKNGCVGLLKTKNLLKWETLPPLFSPGKYSELETPRLNCIDGKWILLFGENTGTMSMRFALSETVLGKYSEPENNIFTPPQCYAGVMIELDGRWCFYHWIMDRNKGKNERYLAPPKLVGLADGFVFLKKDPRMDQFFDETPGDDVLAEINRSHDDKIRVRRKLGKGLRVKIASAHQEYSREISLAKDEQGVSVTETGTVAAEKRTFPISADELEIEFFFHDRFMEVYAGGCFVYALVLEKEFSQLDKIKIE
ncbi:hypothetical protein KY359_01240 [Candidatus Woesearchaeota archaeon]|nr:hypothetical protein [Candidatus Woesearchaeota archaeon]